MKKFLIIITIIIFIILLKFGLTFTLNEIIIKDYQNNRYDNNLINTLYLINLNEPYIVYYNHGNILYKEEQYNEAISKYEKALNKHPAEDRVCDIRINLSLSYIKTIDENNKTSALSTLNKAKNILYEDECASINDDNGKSEVAEKLEEEIKALEEKLKEDEDPNGNGNTPNNNGGQDDPNTPSNIEEQLRELQKQNQRSRQGDTDYYSNLDDYSYYTGQYW